MSRLKDINNITDIKVVSRETEEAAVDLAEVSAVMLPVWRKQKASGCSKRRESMRSKN